MDTYTRCDLTYPEDKLPALSGIARKISEQDRDIYLAGHWRKDLALWLTWYAVRPSDYSIRIIAFLRGYEPSWMPSGSRYPNGPEVDKILSYLTRRSLLQVKTLSEM